ncbi:MAG: hypothetical protein WC634_05470 [archaeon]
MRKFVQKSNLVKRGLAFKKHGKLRISKGGYFVLRARRLSHAKQLPVLIKASVPTSRSRNVLFVCNAGVDTSIDAWEEFVELASKKPVTANLILNNAGASRWPGPELKRVVLESDFVVPIGPFAAQKCSSIISKAKHVMSPQVLPFGAEISDFDWHTLFRRVANQALETIRASLEKEEKGK